MSYKVLRSCTTIVNFFVVYKNAVYKENLSCWCFCYHLTLNVNLLSHENWSLTVSFFFNTSRFQNEEQWQVFCRNRQWPNIRCYWSVLLYYGFAVGFLKAIQWNTGQLVQIWFTVYSWKVVQRQIYLNISLPFAQWNSRAYIHWEVRS